MSTQIRGPLSVEPAQSAHEIGRPELFSYFEAVVSHSKSKRLIGTPGLELKLGTGLARGFGCGTITVRAAVDYEEAFSSHFGLGEYAVEYLKRVSPSLRVYAGWRGSRTSCRSFRGPVAPGAARLHPLQQRPGADL